MGSVSRLLKNQMDELGVTQADLSRAASISKPSIHRLVKGKADINPEWAVKLGYVLDIDPSVLYLSEAREKLDEARSSMDFRDVQRLYE